MLAQNKDAKQECRSDGQGWRPWASFCLAAHDFIHPHLESLAHSTLCITDIPQFYRPLCPQNFEDSIQPSPMYQYQQFPLRVYFWAEKPVASELPAYPRAMDPPTNSLPPPSSDLLSTPLPAQGTQRNRQLPASRAPGALGKSSPTAGQNSGQW